MFQLLITKSQGILYMTMINYLLETNARAKVMTTCLVVSVICEHRRNHRTKENSPHELAKFQ